MTQQAKCLLCKPGKDLSSDPQNPRNKAQCCAPAVPELLWGNGDRSSRTPRNWQAEYSTPSHIPVPHFCYFLGIKDLPDAG